MTEPAPEAPAELPQVDLAGIPDAEATEAQAAAGELARLTPLGSLDDPAIDTASNQRR